MGCVVCASLPEELLIPSCGMVDHRTCAECLVKIRDDEDLSWKEVGQLACCVCKKVSGSLLSRNIIQTTSSLQRDPGYGALVKHLCLGCPQENCVWMGRVPEFDAHAAVVRPPSLEPFLSGCC